MSPPPIASLQPLKFDLRQARAFAFVADELHFGRAAARLFMSQPALSRSIRQLEEAVGVPLLERSTRRVRLTPAGDAFAVECRVALGHLGRAVNAAQQAAQGREGRLRVGYMDFAINGRLPRVLQAFRDRHPRVDIDLQYLPTALQHAALLEGRLDIAFGIGQFDSPAVVNLLVEQEDFVALLPETHRLARSATVRLGDLATSPLSSATRRPTAVSARACSRCATRRASSRASSSRRPTPAASWAWWLPGWACRSSAAARATCSVWAW